GPRPCPGGTDHRPDTRSRCARRRTVPPDGITVHGRHRHRRVHSPPARTVRLRAEPAPGPGHQGSPADLDVIVIGAGMIGLNAAIKLGEAGFGYRVFESRDDIGGTWSRNVYPGAAVDTPSHYYSFSFELNPNWSKYYPTGPEYLAYL